MSAFIVTWLMIGLLALAMSGLLRQIKLLSNRIEGGAGSHRVYPMVGRPFPEFEADSATQIGWRRPALIVFVTRDCDVCSQRLAELSRLAEKDGSGVDYGAVFSGDPDGVRSPALRVFAKRPHMFEELGIRVTPFGVVIVNGRIANAQPVGSRDELKELIRAAGAQE